MAETRAKFGYLTYSNMLQKIDDGVLNAYDFVFTKDTKEYYIITEELEPLAIKARIYVFNSVEEAENALNNAGDTYVGQIVSILDGDVYRGYIVNYSYGKYNVVPLYKDPSKIDYNTLLNIPIKNLVGSLENNIIVSNLSSGTYKIKGQYQITENSDTFYLSSDGDLLIVDDSDGILIKRITSDAITDFKVSDGSIIEQSDYVTDTFLNENGYVTSKYVDSKILALDESIKTEMKKYVQDMIDKNLDDIIDEKVNEKIEEKIKETTNEEVQDLFQIKNK